MSNDPMNLDLNSDGLAIFSGGTLMWVSNYTDERKALDELGEEVAEPGLPTDNFTFHYIPADEMPDWEDASADHYPEIT